VIDQNPKAHYDTVLSVLNRVKETILDAHEEDTLLRQVCEVLHEELAYDLVWIAEVGDDGDVNHRAQHDATEPPVDGAAIIDEVTEEAISRSEPAVVDASNKSRRSGAVRVIVDKDQQLLLGVSARQADGIRPGDFLLLTTLATDLSFAVERMRTEERRERAEEALRMSEERFRRLAEHALTGIVLIQNDLYRYVNRAFAKMFGYNTPAEIIDKLGPLDLAAPESHDLVRENIEKRILGQIRAARYRYVGLRKDGTRFDVEEYGARTIHAQRLGIVATVLDVTAQETSRRRLEALSQAGLVLSRTQTPQRALEEAVTQVTDILACDAACIVLLHDGKLHLAAGAGPLTGDHQLEGSICAAVAGETSLADVPLLQQIAETSKTLIIEDMMVRSGETGTPFGTQSAVPDLETPLKSDGRPRAYAGIPLIVRGECLGFINAESTHPGQFSSDDAQHLRLFADYVAATLQHLRLVASLEEERNRLRTINELSHTLAETLELQEVASRALRHICRVVHADRSVLFLWVPELSILAALAAEGYDDEIVAQLRLRFDSESPNALRKVIEDREVTVNELTTSEDAWYPADIIGEEMTSTLDVPLEAHGELIGIITFFSREAAAFDESHADLTSALSVPVALAIQNARFYEEAAQQAEVMAEALQRQEELDRMKDELIQNISHELRTPLSLVMGYAELLQSGQLGPIPSQQISAVDVISRRTRMLRSLVEDIALLWNLEQQNETMESLDLAELVATTALEFQSQAEDQRLTLTAEIPKQQTMIRGVPVQLRRVLDNLIGNALKFTSPGGHIDVELTTDDQHATLKVADTGIGVPEDKLQRIFERFYQVDGSTRRKYGGTGLGLALVKAIVEAHKGTISAESPIWDDRDRPGTRVIVQLPLYDELAPYRERWMTSSTN
jgi:PAS domain S-box-containing protein